MEQRSVLVADVGHGTDALSVTIGTALWTQWSEIAIEREAAARVARAEVVAQYRHQQVYNDAFSRELFASLVAVSAAAHALDSVYGQLITPELRAAGPREDAGREAHIRECLKRRFDSGKRDQSWVTEFRWLFGLRDAAVHARFVQLPAVPHPSGVTGSGQVNADYNANAAMRAVDLLFDVLSTCAEQPKPTDAEARQWATDYGPLINSRLTQLHVSRDAVPLVTYKALAAESTG